MPIAPDKWRCLGTVTFPRGEPVFPKDPTNLNNAKVPGIYRLTFGKEYLYIGQTKRLRGRFGDYEKPTQGDEHEHVMHSLLLDARDTKVQVKVEVFTEGDLSEESTRLRLEDDEKDAAIKAELPLLNTGGRSRGDYLKFKIKYHRDSLVNARTEFVNWNLNMGKKELYFVRSNDAKGIRFTNCRNILENPETPEEYVLPTPSEVHPDWLRKDSFVWITEEDRARYILEDASECANVAPYNGIPSKLAGYPPADKWALWLDDASGHWQIHPLPTAETEKPRAFAVVHHSTLKS